MSTSVEERIQPAESMAVGPVKKSTVRKVSDVLAGGRSRFASELEQLLNSVEQPEEWIEICFAVESEHDHAHLEDFWLTGLEKFSHHNIYREAIGLYYLREKKYHKSLNYLKKAHDNGASSIAIAASISAAYALAQHHLVWDYFMLLSNDERMKLDDGLLFKVATSAMDKSKYKEAERIFTVIRQRNRADELPSLEDKIRNEFKDENSLQNFKKSMQKNAGDAVKRRQVAVTDWVTYASILMLDGDYNQALDLLLKVKAAHA